MLAIPSFHDPIFIVHPHGLYLWGLEGVFSDARIIVDVPGCFSTIDLFQNEKIAGMIPKGSVVLIMKPAPKLSKIAEQKGWRLSAIAPDLNRRFESKFTINNEFLAARLPILPYLVTTAKGKTYEELRERFGENLVVQAERGHAGSSTYPASSEADWVSLQERFLDFPVKVSPWREGETWTLNAVVTRFGTLVSRPFLQLQNIPACGTINPFTTCGNAHMPIEDHLAFEIMGQAERFGAHLHREGYSGWFGLDVLVKDEAIVGWIECNPRLTASCGVFSAMQQERGMTPFALLHVLETLGLPYDLDMKREQHLLADGFSESHIVLRTTAQRRGDMVGKPKRWRDLQSGEVALVSRAKEIEVPVGEPFAVAYKKGIFSAGEIESHLERWEGKRRN